MRLYELTDMWSSLMADYESAESDAERAEIITALQAVECGIEQKADNYARLVKNATAEADALAEEIKRLTAKKKAAENLVDRLKENLLFAMGVAGATELKTSIGKWRIQKNPLKAVITDEKLVPARFLIEQPPVADKKAMLEEFKETGEVIPGVSFEQNESVRFR